MKILKVTAILIAVSLIVIAIGIHLVLDRAIKQAVEDYGPRLTQSPVTLDGIETSLLLGTAQVEGFVVGNPPEFKAPTAIKLRRTLVRLDWTTALSDTLVVQEVVIDGPEVTFEGSLNRNNLSVLSENVRATNSAVGSTATGTPAPVKADRGRKIILRDFRLTNGHVTVWLTGGKTMSFALPEIHVTDLGARSGGVTPQELVGVIAQALQQAVTRNVAGVGQLANQGIREMGRGATQLKQSVEQGVEGLKSFFERK